MGGDLVQLRRLKPKVNFRFVLRGLTDPYSASFVEFNFFSRPLTKTIDRSNILEALTAKVHRKNHHHVKADLHPQSKKAIAPFD